MKEIEQELLNLPQAERARLAHRLIVSLDEDIPSDGGWMPPGSKKSSSAMPR